MTAQDAEPPPATWPKVAGILCVLYALGGLSCRATSGLLAVGGIGVTGALRITQGVASIVAFVLGILLLVGGAGLILRRRYGPALVGVWAGGRLILLLVTLVVGLLTGDAQVERQRAQQAWMADNTSPTVDRLAAQSDERLWRDAMVGNFLGTAALAAFPVAVGLWMCRPRVRDEVSTWSRGAI